MNNVPYLKNRQEIFDYIWRHLKKQGKRARQPSKDPAEEGQYVCLYRADDGCMCGVGSIIDDSEYKEVFEGLGIRELIGRPGFKAKNCRGNDMLFLHRIQSAHDHSPDFLFNGDEAEVWAKMPERFRTIASDFNLSAAVLEEV